MRTEISSNKWAKLRKEYASSDISYRKMAGKYGIPFSAIRNRAEKEEWPKLRENFKSNTTQKILTKISETSADQTAKAFQAADKFLDVLLEAIDVVDKRDPRALKDLSTCFVNLKEIGLLRAELDKQEQKARIKKLEKEATSSEEKSDNNIKIVFENMPEGSDK